MKILFLEASKTNDQQIEEFVEAINMEGIYSMIILDCYNNLGLIKDVLISECPDVIAFMTTYTYVDKFKQLMPLCEFIAKPIQLWDLNGRYMNDSIERYLPPGQSDKFIVKQFNILNVISGVESAKNIFFRN